MSLFSVPAIPSGLKNFAGGLEVATSVVALLPLGQQNTFDSTNLSTGALTIQATLEEVHSSSVEVTEHPVQTGASITDHSFNRPSEVVLRCGWSNSGYSQAIAAAANLFAMLSGTGSNADYVTGIYTKLTALKEARVPFDIVTSLKLYQSMLITQIQVTRDVKTANVLMCTVNCKEIIRADILYGDVVTSDQAEAQTTAAPQALGSQNLLGYTGGVVPSTLPTANWINNPLTTGTQ